MSEVEYKLDVINGMKMDCSVVSPAEGVTREASVVSKVFSRNFFFL